MLIDIPATMTRTRNAIRALGGDVVVFDVGSPATETEVRDIEQRIGRVIPATLRRVFREQCRRMRMLWTLDDAGKLSKLLGDSLAGGIDLSLEELPTDLLNWSGWRAAFEYPAEHGLPVEITAEDYEELFPLVTATNGDQLVVADPARNPSDAVMYLNHESGDFNFVILSDRLEDFLNSWIQLGCIGPEWWELAPFLDLETFKLSLAVKRSKVWLKKLASA